MCVCVCVCVSDQTSMRALVWICTCVFMCVCSIKSQIGMQRLTWPVWKPKTVISHHFGLIESGALRGVRRRPWMTHTQWRSPLAPQRSSCFAQRGSLGENKIITHSPFFPQRALFRAPQSLLIMLKELSFVEGVFCRLNDCEVVACEWWPRSSGSVALWKCAQARFVLILRE